MDNLCISCYELLFFEIPQFLTDICFVMTALIQESNCSVYCGKLHVRNIMAMLEQVHFKAEATGAADGKLARSVDCATVVSLRADSGSAAPLAEADHE